MGIVCVHYCGISEVDVVLTLSLGYIEVHSSIAVFSESSNRLKVYQMTIVCHDLQLLKRYIGILLLETMTGINKTCRCMSSYLQ